MASEQLVLWKTRRQRLAESVIYPIAVVPIGPAMRLLLGDGYSPLYGFPMLFAVMLIVALLSAKLSGWWAGRHGGEWLTNSEHTRRLIDEARTTSVWPEALAIPAMLVLLMLAALLIIEPFNELGSWLSLNAGFLYMLTAVAVLGTASSILGRRRLLQSVVTDDKPPENLYWSQMRRLVPRMYLAQLVGLTAGIAVGLQFEGGLRFWIYALVMLVISGGLTHLILHRMALRRIYSTPADLSFRSHLWTGLLMWGVPMLFFFEGMMFFETMSRPTFYKVFMFGVTLFASVICGLAFGAFLHFAKRLERR